MTGGVVRFAILFGSTITMVLGFCLWVTGVGKDPYPGTFQLTTLGADDYFVTNRLDERYRTELKVRSVDGAGRPAIAAFGSHVIKHMTTESLGLGDGRFMNFFVMHIGLPGITTLLRKLEAMDRFPRDLILVHVHHPHSSNWSHVSQLVWDLPLHYYLFHSAMKLTDRVRFSLRHLGASLRDRLDVRFVTHELVLGAVWACQPPYGIRPVSRQPVVVPAAEPGILASLGLEHPPHRVFQRSCTRMGGLRRDGSFIQDGPIGDVLGAPATGPVTTEAVPPGGARKIASLMVEIDRMARRNGTRAVFFIPPEFETDRPSEHGRVLARAIDRVAKHLTVLDHRKPYRDRAYFQNNRQLYFKALGDALRSIGAIGAPAR